MLKGYFKAEFSNAQASLNLYMQFCKMDDLELHLCRFSSACFYNVKITPLTEKTISKFRNHIFSYYTTGFLLAIKLIHSQYSALPPCRCF